MSLIGTIAAFCCCTTEEGGICCRGLSGEDCVCIEGLTREECEDANMTGDPCDTGVFLPGLTKCPVNPPDDENPCLVGCCVSNIPTSEITCVDRACIHECCRLNNDAGVSTFTIPVNTCTGPFSPCDEITGACCLPSGQCLDDQTPSTCAGLDGEFHPNQTCARIDCDDDMLVNCCLANDTCVEQIPLQDCLAGGGTTIGQTPCNTKPDPCVNPDGICCNKAAECGVICVTIPADNASFNFPCIDGVFGPICFTPCPDDVFPALAYEMCVMVDTTSQCCHFTVDTWQNLGGGNLCAPNPQGTNGSCILGGPDDCVSTTQECMGCPLGNEWQADVTVIFAANLVDCVCLCNCSATFIWPCPPNNCPGPKPIIANVSGSGCIAQ